MNKASARRLSQSGEVSVGELRAMIAARRGKGGMSSVNSIIPIETALNIYEGALSGRPDEERPAGLHKDVYSGKMRPSKDSLIIQNILRDCA